MSDLKEYIEERKNRDPEFAYGYDGGYEQFKIGMMIREARESAGLSQVPQNDPVLCRFPEEEGPIPGSYHRPPCAFFPLSAAGCDASSAGMPSPGRDSGRMMRTARSYRK